MPPLRNEAQKGLFTRTGLTKQEKTTDIWFDKKTPTIYICTHNTDLKNRLTAYAEQYPDQCKLTEDDVVIGCKSFEIAKGRLSFRLTAPYSEDAGERRVFLLRPIIPFWKNKIHVSEYKLHFVNLCGII